MWRAFRYLWALPGTLLGLAVAAPCVAAGARAQFVEGVLEIAADSLGAALKRRRLLRGSAAITFGHVVIASERSFLAESRAHEHVHVRQYERWGPLFIPLYLGSSLLAVVRGQHFYLGNRFEQAAFKNQGENPVS